MPRYNSPYDWPYIVLTVLGMWKVEDESTLIGRFYWVYQSFSMCYAFFWAILSYFDLYYVSITSTETNTNLSASVTACLFLWKNSVVLYEYRQIQALRMNLRNGLHPSPDEMDFQIKKRAENEIRRTYLSVFTLIAFTLGIWAISPLFVRKPDGSRVMPFPVYIPWEHQSLLGYQLAHFFQVYGAYLTAMCVMSFNLSVYGTITQLCAEYEILKKNTRKINEWHDRLCEGETVRALTKKENSIASTMINENIRHHQRIIYCIEEAENCYVRTTLIQFASTISLAAFVGFDTIVATKQLDSKIVTRIALLGVVFLDAFMFCFYGTRLITKGEELHDIVYQTPWHVMNSDNRKKTMVILNRAQRVPCLTIEKFATMNSFTFLNIVKIIYNLLYLLLQVTTKGKELA